MTEPQNKKGCQLTTRELTALALIAALIVVSKFIFNMPLHVPGHSGLFWMALMVIGRGVVRRPWAGTVLGLTAGLLAVVVMPGRLGLLTWVKYAAPGVLLDLIAPLIRNRFEDPILGLFAGSLANLAKLLLSLIVTVMMGLPAGYIAVGLSLSAVSHAVFGALGGLLGALVLRRLFAAKVPQIDALARRFERGEG